MRSRSRCTLTSGPPLPAEPGGKRRRDNEYERCGTANVFCAVEPKAGRHFTFATPRPLRASSSLRLPSTLALALPGSQDHPSGNGQPQHPSPQVAHGLSSEQKWAPNSGIALPSTTRPKHGSWLNQAEIEIGLFARQCLGNRRIPDLKAFAVRVSAWNRRMNRDQVKINWQFDRRAARRKFGYQYKPFKRSKN